jgi:acyl-CoA thioester hydrolase
VETSLIPASVRPDEARRQRHHYPLWHEIPTRFGDLDPLGHVNNVAIAQLYEESRVWFARTLGLRADLHRVVLVAMTLHYVAETRYPEPVKVGIGVAGIGRTSYTLAHALYQGGQCVGLADSTLVHAPAAGASPLPAEFRSALETVRLT